MVAHELTHALEDQHYDFIALHKLATTQDHATAIKAVIEGSAAWVQMSYLRSSHDRWAVQRAEQRQVKRAETLATAPSFVRQEVMLPYLLGFSFILKGRPWEFGDAVLLRDFDGAYQDPPRPRWRSVASSV